MLYNSTLDTFLCSFLDARQNGEVPYHMSGQHVQYRPDLLVLKNGITVVKNSFISESLLTLCLTIFCNFF